MKRAWTDADTRTLRRLAARGLSLREIGAKMGRNARHINERATRCGVVIKRVCVKREWSSKDIATLRKLYPTSTSERIAERIGRSVSAVNNQIYKMGLRKPDGYVSAIARKRWKEGFYTSAEGHQFKRGQEPWNKGIPGSTGLHPNSSAHHFKRGRPPSEARNYVPVGSEKISHDGYLMRKVTDDQSISPARRWESAHRLAWIAANGPIPDGHIVRFREGLRTVAASEITVDRLECITLEDHMLRNSIYRYPPELVELMKLRGQINRKITQKEKRA